MPNDRVLVKAVCGKRHHVVATLAVRPDGHRVLTLPRLAVADTGGSGTSVRDVRMGGDVIDLDDAGDVTRGDQRRAACSCGLSFLVIPEALERAARAGNRRVVLASRR